MLSYPLLAIEPGGFTQLLHSEAYWDSLPFGFVGIFNRKRSDLVFYAKNGEHWSLSKILPMEPVGFIRRFIQPMRQIRVAVEFSALGRYSADDLRKSLKSAVNADDDILAQHHSHAQILAWLDEAQTVPKIFNLYRFVTKDFRGKPSWSST